MIWLFYASVIFTCVSFSVVLLHLWARLKGFPHGRRSIPPQGVSEAPADRGDTNSPLCVAGSAGSVEMAQAGPSSLEGSGSPLSRRSRDSSKQGVAPRHAQEEAAKAPRDRRDSLSPSANGGETTTEGVAVVDIQTP